MPYATTLYLGITHSMKILRDQLPLQLNTRNLAYFNKQNSYDCLYYVKQTVKLSERAT
jgi:hypothetical protein